MYKNVCISKGDLNMKSMKVFDNLRDAYKLVINKYDPSQWLVVWYDPNKEVIINELSNDEMYDMYMIRKHGRIKKIRRKTKIQVIAKRFKYYKKYLVVVQLRSEEYEQKESIVPQPD